uniref:Uncharacterized protein n=1 Tax=Arundo donax TaxID=35708 RepID=A0A0A9BRP5_ARUDO
MDPTRNILWLDLPIFLENQFIVHPTRLQKVLGFSSQ